ncbi:unnamed protein product [Closterium sp. NIES-64]|nr:unnamed protein product [Closterium sp. NIES-64]
MATPSVLTFDAEGRAVDFEVWVDDLQLFLQCDRADGLSLSDLTSGASPAPPATADSTVRSHWATRDAAARLVVRRHLPTTEHAHFSQYKSAKTLCDAVVAHYSSPATDTLSRLMLPYLFLDLAALPSVADLITNLRTSDTRYRAALPADLCAKNPTPMYITLYHIVTRLLDSLRLVRDHFLSVCPTTVTVDLLEERLLAAEKSIVAVGASRGDPRTPVFEGCSPSPLLPTVASAAAADLVGTESVGTASAPSGRRRIGKGKGGKGAGGAGRCGGGGGGGSGGGGGGGGSGGGGGGVGGNCGGGGGGGGGGGSGGGGGGGGDGGGAGGGGSGGAVAIFDLDYDAILAAMYAVSASDEGDYYLCVPPDLGIEAAALGTSEAASLGANASSAPGAGESALSGAMSAQALHTFTLDSGASRSFFRDRTTLTPLSRPVAVSLADPSGGSILASFSTVLPCPTAPSGTLSGPVPTCDLCVEGQQRAVPYSSEFPPTEAPLQTLHMDVWGPARVSGQGRERYFLLVVDDYSRYTTVFPLRNKGDVTEVLIEWIRATRLQLKESFGLDFPVLRLHSDRGGEFSSARLGAFRRAQAIRQTFTLLASPQQNGIVERRIGMVMDVACTSMIHAAAPHFLWPFAVQYAVHQLNLQPRVYLPESSPTLRWTEKAGNASAFRVWGSGSFVRDLSSDKLSPHAVPCVFLGFPPNAPRWQFYHPTLRHVLSSQDVTFDESVPYYRLFPYHTTPLPSPPFFLVLGPPPVDPLPPQGPALSGAEPGGAESGGAERRGAESGGAELGGAEPGGAEPGGAVSARVASRDASSRRELLSLQELRDLFARHWSHAARAGGATIAAGRGGSRTDGTGAAASGGAAGVVGVGPAGRTARASGSTGAAGPTGVGAAGARDGGGVGAGASEGAGVGGAGAGRFTGTSAAAGGTRAVPAVPGGVARPRPHFILLLEQVLESSLPVLADPEYDSLRAASPTVTHLLAIVVTDPSFESTVASALVAELVDFATRCRLDYAASLVAESESVCPPSVGDPDAPDIPSPRSYAEAIEGPYSSQWQTAMDAKMASWKSRGTYVDEVPPLGANIVSGMWIFKVKRAPGSPPVFKARYVARGFIYGLCQVPREWHDTLRTTLAALGFSPSTADSSLFLRTDTSLPPFYILVYVDDLVFATSDTAGFTHVKSEL